MDLFYQHISSLKKRLFWISVPSQQLKILHCTLFIQTWEKRRTEYFYFQIIVLDSPVSHSWEILDNPSS